MPQQAPKSIYPAHSAGPQRISAAKLAADESRRSFLRMVSHELRTPLNSIIGFSEIISHEMCGPLGNPQYQEYAGLIGQSGHRLLKLVNQILDIVRLEGQAADLDLRVEALEPLVEDAFNQLSAEAEARGVTLRLENAAALPDVIADPRALQTVLVNLLQNAVAASARGGPVQVRARRHGAEVRIEVQDHGEGVDPEDIPRIMRPFEQGEHALTRRAEGAGLGLPIVHLLCQAMGGRVELSSRRGEGLCAIVTLPAA